MTADMLKLLIQDAGLDLHPDALLDLVKGVNAAPEPVDPEAWLALLGGPVPEAQKAGFQALKAEQSGLGDEPDHAERLAGVRAEMARLGVDGFVVPRADEHQGEYVPPCAERLSWLTGFTGSAGVAVVLTEQAGVFVDGRYTLQVRDQIELNHWTPLSLMDDPHVAWAASHLSAGDALGYDPRLHTQTWAEAAGATLARRDITLMPLTENPVDAAWAQQPPAPLSPVVLHAETLAGQSSQDKRAALSEALQSHGVDAVVLTSPDAIAWLLNVRGADVPHTPLPLSFALLRASSEVDWFIDLRKVPAETRDGLDEGIRLHPPTAFEGALQGLTGVVQADPALASAWIFHNLGQATVRRATDPCMLPKALKNPVEQDGARAAHVRDGVALTRFLAWIDAHAPGVTEMQAADQLLAFRLEHEGFRDLSFDTISGAGPNGAIVHYRVSEATDRVLEANSLYLVDSGAQYPDGTTDVTRTVAIGEPTDEMCHRFTRVLQGHIALGTARFPEGTTGAHLDALARRPLWDDGLDYDHGTGHGVGSHLSVHEGPHRISRRPSSVPLQPGMICSNEPGYYKAGEYGIRVENLVLVQRWAGSQDRPMLCFETLTLAPIDRRLIKLSLLSPAERTWVDTYHAQVKATLTPLLDEKTARWLEAACAPL